MVVFSIFILCGNDFALHMSVANLSTSLLRVLFCVQSISIFSRPSADDVGLQKQLLEGGALKPDILFLESFAAIVGGKWPSLASSLSLSENEIEEVRKEGEELGQAFQMLKQWVQREDATYSLLCQTLKTASLSQL